LNKFIIKKYEEKDESLLKTGNIVDRILIVIKGSLKNVNLNLSNN